MLHSSLAALQSNIEHKRIERLHNHDNSKELFKEFLASSSNLDSNVLNPDRVNRKFTQYRDTIPVTSVREGESEETRSSHFHTYYRSILKIFLKLRKRNRACLKETCLGMRSELQLVS